MARTLRGGGLEVDGGVYDLPTALEPRAGDGELVVAVCAEYDALPDVGHACGHNIIAATAVGAGLALAAVADDIGLTVRVLGTPAEEGGGGKILMLERGAFDGVHAAMMVHPWPTERLDRHLPGGGPLRRPLRGTGGPRVGRPLGRRQRAGCPHRGAGGDRPPAPAVAPGDQVHGVVTHSSAAANIIPAAITARYMVRSRTAEGLAAPAAPGERLLRGRRTRHRLLGRLRGAAPEYSAHGGRPRPCSAPTAPTPRRSDGTSTPTMPARRSRRSRPTWRNVSLAVPTIHPLIGIETHGAVNHQPEFAAACVTPSADPAVRDGAVALAGRPSRWPTTRSFASDG